MRRTTFDKLLGWVGASLGIVLLAVGGLLLWGSGYIHNIAVHVANMTGGKTYSQVSAQAQAQPDNAKLQAEVSTVFKGETLRSMLLNAYGWWKVSQLTYFISLVMFGLGTVSFLGGLVGFGRIRRERPGAVVFVPPAIEQINKTGHQAGSSA
jgi:hypothetical protein